MTPARALMVAPYLPDPAAPHAGGRASALWLSELLRRGPVDLVALGSAGDAARAARIWPTLSELQIVPFRSGLPARFMGAVRDGLGGQRPGGVRRRLRDAVRARLDEHAYRFVLVEHEETALWLGLHGPPAGRILDCHDVLSAHFDHDPAANPVPDLIPDAASARRLETRLLGEYARVAVRSRADYRRLAALAFDPPLALLHHPIPLPATAPPRAARRTEVVLVTGSFRRAPNVAAAERAARDIFPLVRARRPAAELHIVGDGADVALAGLAREPGVTVKGRQPDLADVYAMAGVFLNPTRAGGGVLTRNLEALAAGLPIVTTPAGLEGLDLPDDLRARLAGGSEPGEIAEALLRLLGDALAWTSLAEDGRRAVAEVYAPEVVRAEFSALIDDGASGAGAGS